jgi:hypothetical protein
MLRRIFGPKREEVTGWWRKLLQTSFVIDILHEIILDFEEMNLLELSNF